MGFKAFPDDFKGVVSSDVCIANCEKGVCESCEHFKDCSLVGFPLSLCFDGEDKLCFLVKASLLCYIT